MAATPEHYLHTNDRPVDLQLGSKPELGVAVLAADAIAVLDVSNHTTFTYYHRQARRLFDLIVQPQGVSYYARRADHPPVALSQISINFTIGIALSSLARYHPKQWRALLDGQDGWVIKEYLRTTPLQFLALMAGEITGSIIQRPYSDLR